MNIESRILKNEETVSLNLRDIYRKYGYSCFKMSKFEEYDLYSRNKDFLVSDSVITFNDTNGRLMALKPDVTLSIVKNYKPNGGVQRLYYNENVYRISDKTHQYKEIMQVGLECMGDVDEYNLYEVIGLAAESLNTISERCVLNISHLGILSAILSPVTSQADRAAIIECVSDKNAHGLDEVCERCALTAHSAALLKYLVSAYGDANEVLDGLTSLTDDGNVIAAADQLRKLAAQLAQSYGSCVRVDLSLVSDMNYYNGIVFCGFIEGVPSSVLSGGQYDRLMDKMGKEAKAIGFAVYLDMLERMKEEPPYTVDVLLLYGQDDDKGGVCRRVAELVAEGKCVSAQTDIPDKLYYRAIERFNGGAENE